MKHTLFLPALLLTTGVALAATSVPASAGVFCTGGTVTAGGNAYSSCSGPIDGNNLGAGTDNLLYRLNSGNSSLLPQLTNPGGSPLDFTQYQWSESTNALGFKSDNGTGGTSGTWSIDAGKSLNSPFAIAVKGGPDYSVYFFNNLSNITSGFWNTLGIEKGNGTSGPGLSHINLYTTSAKPVTTSVPEPGTILGLMAFGIGGILTRKQSKNGKPEKVTA